MAYIGRNVTTDKTTNTKSLDSLTAQFNGAQTVFALSSSSAAVYPSSERNLLISLNGVIQAPVTAYTVSGSTITFTAAPATNTAFFGTLLGAMADYGQQFGQISVDGAATFSNNVTVLGTFQVGNSTITINSTTLLVGNASSNVVINSSAVGIGSTTVTAVGLAATNAANTSANGVVTTGTQSLAGDKTFVNNVTITGNLTVLGTAVTLNSENVLIKDNILTLSSNVTGSPILDAGIEVNRGTSANVTLKWNETSDKWQLTNDGSTYENIVLPSTAANSSANGVVSTTTQTFAGDKTFQNTTSFSNTVSITGAANTLSTLGVTGTLSALGQLSVTGNATFDTSTLFVDATNDRVGIGTTTPANSKLHVLTSGTTGYAGANRGILITDAIGGRLFLEANNSASGSRLFLLRSEANNFSISSMADNGGSFVNENILVAAANGNLGVGTTTPGVKLQVNGTIVAGSSTNTRLEITNNGVVQEFYSTESNPRWKIHRDLIASGAPGIGFSDASNTIGVVGSAIGIPYAATRTLSFYTSNATSLVERARIDSAGSLLVGSTSNFHGAKLNVAGKSFFPYASDADIGGIIYGYNDTASFSYAGGLKFQIYTFNGTSYVMSDAVTISGVGNVGIATTTPGFKLDVNGDIGSNSTYPLTFYGNGNSGTYTRTVIYANQNNTAGNASNGIFIERGRLTNSASGEIRSFVIGDRGGGIQFILNKDGNVGIGTASPNALAKLDVNGDIYVQSVRALRKTTSTQGTAWFHLGSGVGSSVGAGDMRSPKPYEFLPATITPIFTAYNFDGTGGWADGLVMSHYSDGTGGDANIMAIFKNGSGVKIARQTYESSTGFSAGTIYTLNYTAASDASVKENVQSISNAMATILQLRPVTFEWTDEYILNGMSRNAAESQVDPDTGIIIIPTQKVTNVGLIAQEVEAVLPTVVHQENVKLKGASDYLKNINYDKLVPHLIAALQEQQTTIAQLEARVAALEG